MSLYLCCAICCSLKASVSSAGGRTVRPSSCRRPAVYPGTQMVEPMVAGVTSALAIPGVNTGFGNTTPAGAEGTVVGVGFELELAAVRASDAADDAREGDVGALESAQTIAPITSAATARIASRLQVVLRGISHVGA